MAKGVGVIGIGVRLLNDLVLLGKDGQSELVFLLGGEGDALGGQVESKLVFDGAVGMSVVAPFHSEGSHHTAKIVHIKLLNIEIQI